LAAIEQRIMPNDHPNSFGIGQKCHVGGSDHLAFRMALAAVTLLFAATEVKQFLHRE
jgi:hypothetical protein